MINVGKKMRAISALFVKLVGVAGFEPATPSSRTRCSTRLSHTPTDNAAYTIAVLVRQACRKTAANAAVPRLPRLCYLGIRRRKRQPGNGRSERGRTRNETGDARRERRS